MLLRGRQCLVLGVANGRSLAWTVACGLRAHGAEVAVGVKDLGRFGGTVRKLASQVSDGEWDPLVVECDVDDDGSIDKCRRVVEEEFDGTLNALVHSIAFAPAACLKGSGDKENAGILAQTSRDDFLQTMETSVYSFIAVGRSFAPLLIAGASQSSSTSSLLTLTFDASNRVVPGYNIMGPAKGALESCCRYAAYELGPQNVRVNAISSGPVNTLAARGIPGFLNMRKASHEKQLLPKAFEGAEVANAAAFLASDLANSITGQTVYVDNGVSIVK